MPSLPPRTQMAGLSACEFFDLESKHVGDTFRVFVARPMGEITAAQVGQDLGDQKFPAVYALDGNAYFTAVFNAQRLLAMAQEGTDGYTIGIGYPRDEFATTMGIRFRDLTPSAGGEQEASMAAAFGPEAKAGGGAAFLRFITEELKPLIKEHYAVDPSDSTIAGASLGGLFSGWTLLHHPASFERYIIISPAIWWERERVWDWLDAAAELFDDIKATAFVSAGALETAANVRAQMEAGLEAEGQMGDIARSTLEQGKIHGFMRMAEITPIFAQKLGESFKNLDILCHNFPEETHMSVPFGAIARGLRFVFGKWRPA